MKSKRWTLISPFTRLKVQEQHPLSSTKIEFTNNLFSLLLGRLQARLWGFSGSYQTLEPVTVGLL